MLTDEVQTIGLEPRARSREQRVLDHAKLLARFIVIQHALLVTSARR